MTKQQSLSDIEVAVLADSSILTPSYIYDERIILSTLNLLSELRELSPCQVLYSIKAVSTKGLLEKIAFHVNGFSTSSLFESRLAREIMGDKGSVHMTSPGIRSDEVARITEQCDYLTFNSLSQWERIGPEICEHISCGIRINPELSFVDDDRYNPCRPNSKLGVSIPAIRRVLKQDRTSLHGMSGIHFHNNCESRNFAELDATVTKLCDDLSDYLPEMTWINLGGGYFLENGTQITELVTPVKRLKDHYGLDIFFEPGKAVVGRAGHLVTSVIDLFESGGMTIAILDSSINHLPEIFEYQYKPVVTQATDSGEYEYRLAGASCLSGDLLGDYRFDSKLAIGSKIIIENIGAYMLVKANMFNGINLPSVYILEQDRTLQLLKQFDYSHYRDRL
jgi:carboxynorspermidine decarboxylase